MACQKPCVKAPQKWMFQVLCPFYKMEWLYLWLWQYRFASLSLFHFMKPWACLLMPMYLAYACFLRVENSRCISYQRQTGMLSLPSVGLLLDYTSPSSGIMWNLWSLKPKSPSVTILSSVGWLVIGYFVLGLFACWQFLHKMPNDFTGKIWEYESHLCYCTFSYCKDTTPVVSI